MGVNKMPKNVLCNERLYAILKLPRVARHKIMDQYSQKSSSDQSNAEKRYFPRWQVKNRIVYRFDGDASTHEARSRDLSCAGVSLVSPYPVASNQKLKLRIYLFEDDSVEVEGNPVWVEETKEGHLLGITFTNTSSEIQEKILKYAFEIKKEDVVNHWFEGWNKK